MRFDWSVVFNNLDLLEEGLKLSLAATGLALVLSLICGLGLALARSARWSFVRGPATAYIELFRNTPLLIQLYLIYFGLPIIGIVIPTFTTAVLALTLQHSAFIAEILRGGFLAISRPQREAGRALGMTPDKVFRIVVLPQALAACIPGLTGAAVILLQDTSLVAAISMVDLTMAAKLISTRSSTSFEPFIAIAIIYLVLGAIIAQVGRLLERRLRIAR
jgi:polar amino acid transport system permease protein